MRTESPLTNELGGRITNPRLIRAAVVVAAILLSVLLAWRGPSGRLALLFIGAGPAFIAFLFYQRQPALGLMALVAAGLLMPFSIGTGTGTTLNPVILLVPVLTGLWLADMALRQKAIRLHRHNSITLLLVFNVIVVLSFIVGQLPWFDISGAGFAAQLGGLMVFVISSAAFLLAAHLLDERRLERLVYLFIAIGALIIVGRFVPLLGAVVARLVGSGAQGSVFWIWVMALPAGLALFHTSLKSGVRLALAAFVTVALLSRFIGVGEWASGWAPSLVALLLLLWLRFPRWGWIVVLLSLIVFFLEFDRIWFMVTNSESWLARWQAWQIVLDTMRVNPLLGLGPSNYYFYVQRAVITGWGGAWNVQFSSHNNWVDLIAQTGILGTAVFGLFVASIGRVGWHLYRQLPNGFARAYAAAAVTGLIATLISGMLGDWFLPFVYNIGLEGMRSSVLFWVFMGGLLGIYMNYPIFLGAASSIWPIGNKIG